MKWLTRIFKYGLWLVVLGLVSSAAVYYYLEPQLPPIENLRDIKLQVPLRIYSRDQRLIAEFGEKRRNPIVYADLPELMIQAFLAAEDDRFFEHPGVDYKGLLRAARELLLTGKRRQGGSTITMQVARNFYLSREKTFTRKINEILLALRIEQQLTKQEILALYLNKIYLGQRAYGVGAASLVYYGKNPDQLALAQIAMIAGLPKAPSTTNPITNPKRALERRGYVLKRMKALGFISGEAYRLALDVPITAKLHAPQVEVEAPHIAEMVRSEMIGRFGDQAYTEGYHVFTSLDSRLQTVANRAVRKALQAYDQRHGYRGVLQHLDLSQQEDEEAWDKMLADLKSVAGLRPGLVIEVLEQSASVYLGGGEQVRIEWEGLKWARPHVDENYLGDPPKVAAEILKPGDFIHLLPTDKEGEPGWRLAQIPAVEGVLVSLDTDNGAILALVGGYDFYHSKFNRVIQAKRQPGSGFKAFIYSAALEAGFTAASLINDAPVVFDDPGLEAAWRPENYSGKFFGPTRLRYALTKSRNLVSIRLLRSMGISHALEHIKKFGFDPDKLSHNLSLALGSAAVSPLQMATGYAVLANGGYRIEPYLIERIEDGRQQLVYEAAPLRVCSSCKKQESSEKASLPSDGPQTVPERIAPRVISPENHYLMNSMMRDVIQRGTGRRARSLGRQDLAGKTGTTNEQRDAWFNGFSRSLVAIAWVGFDSSAPLGKGEVGGRAALPVWIDYMEEALEGVEEQPLEMPTSMVTVRIDPVTGKRAHVGQANAIFEVFRARYAPTELLPETGVLHGEGRAGSAGPGVETTEELF